MTATAGAPPPVLLTVDGLAQLVRELQTRGHTVIGPTVRDGAIAYEEIAGVGDLPMGWGDEQEPGRYRLRERDDEAFFGYSLAPTSWKRFLFPPRTVLFTAERDDSGIHIDEHPEAPPRYAFIGIRACEIAAVTMQRRIFLDPKHPDPTFASRSEGLLLVAVSCGDPAATCFCVSAGTGPEATEGYDIRLTELHDGGRHDFLAQSGSEAGADVLAAITHGSPTDDDMSAAGRVVERARERMGRTVELGGVRELLARNAEHPRWDDVATRCLACANCTMACPTCFCSDTVDENPIGADGVVRARTWASCFEHGFSEMHGGTVRTTVRGRYRQWLTHKMSTWVDQFGTLGCVGCGRCITMCPVGIDITEEVTAIRRTDGAGSSSTAGTN